MNSINIKFRNLEIKRLAGQIDGPVNIHNNSTLRAVSRIEGQLVADFSFSCNYEPGIGLIRIEGDVIVRDSEENIERALKEWEKGGKNLPSDIAERIHNAILSSCTVESVVLSKEVGLPAPIPTPAISLTKREETGTKPGRPCGDDTKSYIR